MTQRKFRYLNSNTGDLYAYKVQEQDRCYYEFYQNYSLVGEAPPVVVENSDDWQEITEPILVTEDGYEITSPFEQLWLADLADYEVYPIRPDEEAIDSQDYVFYEFSNAQAYIENHKPKYSKADLERLEYEANKIKKPWEKEREVIRSFKKMIQNLKQSKQKNSNK